MIKISYLKKFNIDGCVYNQTITIDSKDFFNLADKFHIVCEDSIKNGNGLSIVHLSNTKKEYLNKGVKYYLKLKQLKEIAKILQDKRIKGVSKYE